MAQQLISIGAAPNDFTGDPLRTAFDKANDNDTELYAVAPTANEKAALAGTSGAPAVGNKYVTDSDSRLTNSRAPTGAAGGVLAGTYPNPSFANDVVSLASMVNMAQNTIMGRVTASTGDPEHLTPAQARAVMDVYSTSQVPLTWLALTDTPNAYTGQAGKYVIVNVGETALDFITPGAGYTNENAQDAVGGILDNGTVGTIVFTYDDPTPLISAVNKDASVTNAKLANVASGIVKGRISLGSGVVEDLSPVQARSVVDVYSRAEVDSLFTAYATTFTALTDTPSSYTGQANKVLAVNAGETAVEFITAYGDENAQDAIGLILDNGAIGDINFSYNDVTPVISGVVKNDSITYAKIQNVSATSRFLGRITGGAGDVEELTGTQATTLLDVFTSGLKGLAPASGGGTTNFLRADGTWAATGGGTIGGSTGSVDNALLRADGTGGATVQASSVILDDNANLVLGTTALAGTVRTITPNSSGANVSLILDSKGSGHVVVGSSAAGHYPILDVLDTDRTVSLHPTSLSLEAISATGVTGAWDIQMAAGIASSNSGGTIRIRGGNAYGISGNGNGGNVLIQTGTKNGSGIDGNLGIFTTSGSFGGGGKVIFIGNATTASSTAPTGGVILEANAGELFVRDTSNNSTLLSPHGFELMEQSEPMAWAFLSSRTDNGIKTTINVDMLKVIRSLENLTGEQFVYIQQEG